MVETRPSLANPSHMVKDFVSTSQTLPDAFSIFLLARPKSSANMTLSREPRLIFDSEFYFGGT